MIVLLNDVLISRSLKTGLAQDLSEYVIHLYVEILKIPVAINFNLQTSLQSWYFTVLRVGLFENTLHRSRWGGRRTWERGIGRNRKQINKATASRTQSKTRKQRVPQRLTFQFVQGENWWPHAALRLAALHFARMLLRQAHVRWRLHSLAVANCAVARSLHCRGYSHKKTICRWLFSSCDPDLVETEPCDCWPGQVIWPVRPWYETTRLLLIPNSIRSIKYIRPYKHYCIIMWFMNAKSGAFVNELNWSISTGLLKLKYLTSATSSSDFLGGWSVTYLKTEMYSVSSEDRSKFLKRNESEFVTLIPNSSKSSCCAAST